jgi:molybdopterin synthase catalytic subunit
MDSLRRVVRVQAEPFDASAESEALVAGRADMGALVTFTGFCRDEGGTLAALEIEHYPGMAEAEIGAVVDRALERWPLGGVVAIHRHGRLTPGAPIVLVACASAHRAAAFEAAAFLMDYLKSEAPFWKKEHRRDGTPGAWVAPRAADAQALERWDDAGTTVQPIG